MFNRYTGVQDDIRWHKQLWSEKNQRFRKLCSGWVPNFYRDSQTKEMSRYGEEGDDLGFASPLFLLYSVISPTPSDLHLFW